MEGITFFDKMYLIILQFITINAINVTSYSSSLSTGFSTSNFLQKLGYSFEAHENIETSDGYLLTLHRIPHGINNSNNVPKKKPILLMPGLGMSSESYIVSGPNESLALLLTDAGFDVWLGNPRGSTHSLKHKTLHVNNSTYWNYSWHEIGVYDLPAMITYILSVTNNSEIYYVGHSQGGTAFFVMASSLPQMNKVIKLMIGLAPGAFYGNNGRPNVFASTLFQFLNLLQNVLRLYYFDYEIFSNLSTACEKLTGLDNKSCTFILFGFGAQLASYSKTKLEKLEIDRTFSLMLKVDPDSFSIKQAIHYLQLILTAQFQKFDYGIDKNLKIYGKAFPPLYKLEEISAPVAVFYGIKDMFVTPANSMKLINKLPNVVYSKLIDEYPWFAHENMIFHSKIQKLLYAKVLSLLN